MIASYTQTYGDERLELFRFKAYDQPDASFRSRLASNVLAFHGSSAGFRRAVEEADFVRKVGFSILEYPGALPYPRTLERSLRRLRDDGVRHVLFLQDDVFSVAGQASFEALHAYATAGDFELLSVELTPQEVDVAGCGRVFETDELTVYAASSEDYRRSGVWAMDDGPFLARIDFLLDRLYDERYFSMPDVWSAEAYLKEKIEQDPVPRFLTDVRFYWRANLLGRNADRRRGYRFLQARFPDAAPEVQRSLSRLARS